MKIYIDKSKMHGKGIFASKDIKKGETVFIIKGEKVKFLINDKKQAKIAGLNWVGFGKNTWIDPNKYCVYFNHSCEPNTYFKGKVTVVASRNIKKGEEITFDYSLNESDIFWQMSCNCGTKNCRKIIKPIQFISNDIFIKKKVYIPIYFQKIYKQFNINNFKNIEELKNKWLIFIKKGFNI